MKSLFCLYRFAFLLLVAAILPAALLAQEAEETQQGKNYGDYNVRQSIELGYRFSDFTGNTAVYDTFVNLNQGPRLFNQSLEMHSLDHNGYLFDDLYMNSFGYGGDPNDVTRLGISKNKWYNFNAQFRRDRNLWNYDLLANPLNPATSNPSVPITYSPHLMQLSRRMSDYNLVLLPQSKIRFRLGYSRNINEGPSFSTIHEGTDTVIFQNWKTTLNAYQFGVDIKLIPKTNISYDQFLQYYKGDTSFDDQNFSFQLSNGTPLDLGLIWNTGANSPCAAPVSNPSTTPPTGLATCNGYTAYTHSQPIRTHYPVEQLSFQSNPFQSLDLSGRFSYSSSPMEVPNSYEFFQGLARNRQAQFAVAGLASGERVSVSTDLAATVFVTKKFRIQDEFRFWNFRIPGYSATIQNNLFSASMTVAPNVFNPATCPSTPSTCPNHTSSSAADVIGAVSSRFLGQNTRVNTIQFMYDFNRKLGARLGYRHRNRKISASDAEGTMSIFYPSLPNRGACVGVPLNADGSCTATASSFDSEEVKIKEDSLLLGFWTRPVDDLRITYDMEIMYADHSFTRISPRQYQHYKLRTQYKPSNLVHLSTTANIYQGRDNVATTDHRDHNWSFGADAAIVPNDRWSVDFGYDFNDVFSQTDICFAFTGTPPVSTTTCPIISGTGGLAALSVYKNKTNYGFADLMFKPVSRVTFNAGYMITATTGNTVILNPNAPAGPLQYNYHTPYASVKVDIQKGFSWKAGWNFYDYNEKDEPIDLTGPRAFRGNNLALSLVYSF